MRAREFILEASGLKAARPGEIYTDPNGVDYSFQHWYWEFPSDERLQYDNADEMLGDIDEVSQDYDIRWTNQAGRAKSFAFAEFKSTDGNIILVGKFFQQKRPTNTITDTETRNATGLSAKKTASIKVEAKLNPADFGIADGNPYSINTIAAAVSKHSQGSMLSNAINSAVSDTPIVFAGGKELAPAIQDDFCELLAPIAIISGHSVIKGSLDKAVADIFKGSDISGASISFPVERNNPLIDSYIIAGGISMGVSHKGKSGASATITNVWKAKEEAIISQPGYITTFAIATEILDICRDQSGINQPVTLGLKFKIINDLEAKTLLELMKNPRNPTYQLEGNLASPNAVVRNPSQNDLAKVPPELMRLFRMGGYKSGSYVGFLCLARVAHLVAEFINNDQKINFGEAIRSFLNHSAMVQASSYVVNQNNDAVLNSISISYPPNFQGKATIRANGYSGTMIKGKFSFSLPST